MNVPEGTRMRETLHGTGAKGMVVYGYADTAGLGVRMEARRKDRRSAFVETWFLDALPGREFGSFLELRAAASVLTEAEVAAVAAEYPKIVEAEPDTCGNRCRLCPREAQPVVTIAGSPTHDTVRVSLAYSWKDVHGFSLCDNHFEQYNQDPAALKRAVEDEITLRMARFEARQRESVMLQLPPENTACPF